MPENKTIVTDPKAGDVIVNKDANDESKKGGVTATFSEEQQVELAKLIQSNVDKTAGKLKTFYEAQITKLQDALEGEKKAKMTEAEKVQYEKDNYEELKASFEKEKLSFALTKKIADAGLPTQFADLWLSPPTTTEALDAKIEEVKALFGGYKTKVLEGYRKDNVRSPEGTKSISTGKVMERSAFEKLQPAQRSAFIRSGGTLE